MSNEEIATRAATWTADIVGLGAIVATIAGYLPILAAMIALFWYCIQIWESRTVQHWYQNRKMIRKARKIAQLKAKEKVISAQLDALETIRQAKVEARDKLEIAKVEAAKLQLKQETEAEEKTPSDIP
jgi:hypothetical protein